VTGRLVLRSLTALRDRPPRDSRGSAHHARACATTSTGATDRRTSTAVCRIGPCAALASHARIRSVHRAHDRPNFAAARNATRIPTPSGAASGT
jgi:hypothetical protein